MAFLNNSGDIILDAVLTDAGRQRMARGEFKIVKFAFSDEEIDYSLYDANHANGSAFSDLSIMQTPILEAFTNNTSLMKTKLISLSRNNILYLPIFRVNDMAGNSATTIQHTPTFGGFYLTADKATTEVIDFTDVSAKGYIRGHNIGNQAANTQTKSILVDQGLDTGGEPPITEDLPDDLLETAFLVRIDHRLLRLHSVNQEQTEYDSLRHSFVDDDAIATYYISSTNIAVRGARNVQDSDGGIDSELSALEMFDGPLGNRLQLMVQPSPNVKQSTALFTELGSVDVAGNSGLAAGGIKGTGIANHHFIDTMINVVGVTTGYSLDIPLRIIKKKD